MENFWKKIDVGLCWEWTGAKKKGYGLFNLPMVDGVRGGQIGAHRMAWKLLVDPDLPDWLDLDHLCRNHACCDPDHLEPVTRAENLRRGRSANAEKTHCPKGHPYDDANTWRYFNAKAGYWVRICRTCRGMPPAE